MVVLFRLIYDSDAMKLSRYNEKRNEKVGLAALEAINWSEVWPLKATNTIKGAELTPFSAEGYNPALWSSRSARAAAPCRSSSRFN
jgi:hypothetical protein